MPEERQLPKMKGSVVVVVVVVVCFVSLSCFLLVSIFSLSLQFVFSHQRSTPPTPLLYIRIAQPGY